MLLGNFEVGLDKSHSRDSAEADDHLWVDQLDLLAQIIDACILLLRQRISVLGRAAFPLLSAEPQSHGGADPAVPLP